MPRLWKSKPSYRTRNQNGSRYLAFLSLARTARIAPRLAHLYFAVATVLDRRHLHYLCRVAARLPPRVSSSIRLHLNDARHLSRRQYHARSFTDARAIVCVYSLASATRWSSGLLVFLCRSRHKSSIGRPSTWRQQRNYFFHFSFAASERASANSIARAIFTMDSVIDATECTRVDSMIALFFQIAS